MSLFEKLNNKRYDLQEKKKFSPKGQGELFPDPWESGDNTVQTDTDSSTGRKPGEPIKKKFVKNPNSTKNKSFFNKAKYDRDYKELLVKRKKYGIDPSGKISNEKEAVRKFLDTANTKGFGRTTGNKSKVTQAQVEAGLKKTQQQLKDTNVVKQTLKKITDKYGRRLGAKATKAELDATKTAIKTSKTMGTKAPLDGRNIQKIQTPLKTKTKTITTPKRVVKLLKPVKALKKIATPELEKIKPKVTTGNQIPFVQTPPKALKKIATPELEKIRPKVTTSKTAFVQPPAKKKILTQTQKLSQKLMKNKNKYAKIAGVTLATGAAILGTNRVMQAQKKQKKAIAALAKDNPKNYTPVDVDLFLNKSGTSPSSSSSKFITPKITTPKNNPKSKYTSGVSNAAKNNATLSYDPNKIASYAKPSISSKDIKPPKPISKKERNKINQQVNKYVSDRK